MQPSIMWLVVPAVLTTMAAWVFWAFGTREEAEQTNSRTHRGYKFFQKHFIVTFAFVFSKLPVIRAQSEGGKVLDCFHKCLCS